MVWTKEGMVEMAPYANMSNDAAALAKKTEEAIRVVTAPIYGSN